MPDYGVVHRDATADYTAPRTARHSWAPDATRSRAPHDLSDAIQPRRPRPRAASCSATPRRGGPTAGGSAPSHSASSGWQPATGGMRRMRVSGAGSTSATGRSSFQPAATSPSATGCAQLLRPTDGEPGTLRDRAIAHEIKTAATCPRNLRGRAASTLAAPARQFAGARWPQRADERDELLARRRAARAPRRVRKLVPACARSAAPRKEKTPPPIALPEVLAAAIRLTAKRGKHARCWVDSSQDTAVCRRTAG